MKATRQTAADIAVVDYGLGNLRSVTRGLERAGAAVDVSADPAAFADADGIVLPGVGAFSEGMENAGPFREFSFFARCSRQSDRVVRKTVTEFSSVVGGRHSVRSPSEYEYVNVTHR